MCHAVPRDQVPNKMPACLQLSSVGFTRFLFNAQNAPWFQPKTEGRSYWWNTIYTM